MHSTHDLNGKNAPARWGATKVFVSTIIATVLGLIYGLTLAFSYGVSELGPGLLFTSVLGGFVGLVSALLFMSTRKLQILAAGSMIRMTAVFAVLGMLPGALLFSVFSEGLAMALYQAVYGSIVGGLIGGGLGLLMAGFRSK
jgi:hypothetical protein